MLISVIKNGNKILLCGNGGSAADSQHIAGEFINRFRKDRIPLPATIGFTGDGGGKLKDFADICIRVPSLDTPRIQEAHILWYRNLNVISRIIVYCKLKT